MSKEIQKQHKNKSNSEIKYLAMLIYSRMVANEGDEISPHRDAGSKFFQDCKKQAYEMAEEFFKDEN